jgi:hypothetical protein
VAHAQDDSAVRVPSFVEGSVAVRLIGVLVYTACTRTQTHLRGHCGTGAALQVPGVFSDKGAAEALSLPPHAYVGTPQLEPSLTSLL